MVCMCRCLKLLSTGNARGRIRPACLRRAQGLPRGARQYRRWTVSHSLDSVGTLTQTSRITSPTHQGPSTQAKLWEAAACAADSAVLHQLLTDGSGMDVDGSGGWVRMRLCTEDHCPAPACSLRASRYVPLLSGLRNTSACVSTSGEFCKPRHPPPTRL